MFIINQENWKIVKETNVIGSNYEQKVKPIAMNDIIVVYVIRPISSIVGIFSVRRNYTDNKKLFLGGIYQYRLELINKINLEKPIKIKILISKLNFIKNKINWYTHFFGVKGVRKLSEKDYNIILEISKEME